MFEEFLEHFAVHIRPLLGFTLTCKPGHSKRACVKHVRVFHEHAAPRVSMLTGPRYRMHRYRAIHGLELVRPREYCSVKLDKIPHEIRIAACGSHRSTQSIRS